MTTRTTQSWMGREVRRVEKVDLGCLGGGSMNMIKYDQSTSYEILEEIIKVLFRG